MDILYIMRNNINGETIPIVIQSTSLIGQLPLFTVWLYKKNPKKPPFNEHVHKNIMFDFFLLKKTVRPL